MNQTALFGEGGTYTNSAHRPLADRMRPQNWDEFAGLERIDANLLARLKAGAGVPPSLVLWGPPGCGKTTLARLIGASFDINFVEFSAVLGGVKEVREIVAAAKHAFKPTLLFVDEIHRFNKAQQDAFLPHVERGTIVLIGATTENPSFALTSALLSRCKVIQLSGLANRVLEELIQRVAKEFAVSIDEKAVGLLCDYAGGDARRLLNTFEGILQSGLSNKDRTISFDILQEYFSNSKTLIYDRSGEEHYNCISAFIKSLRGSSADGALYWGFRMLEAGEDPRFIIRRLMIFASEDIGNADPRALQVATATAEAFDRIGLPEGRIPIAQCITYLATAPKSNKSYAAMNEVLVDVQSKARVEVPLHLRNAPTSLMSDLGYGEGYNYPHDNKEGYASNVQYLPDDFKDKTYYRPSDRGYELRINERMQFLKELDNKHGPQTSRSAKKN